MLDKRKMFLKRIDILHQSLHLSLKKLQVSTILIEKINYVYTFREFYLELLSGNHFEQSVKLKLIGVKCLYQQKKCFKKWGCSLTEK